MNKQRLNLYLFFFIIIGLYGLYSKEGLLLFGSLLAVIFILLAGLWNRYALSRVKVKGVLNKNRVGVGEEGVYYRLEVTNRKLLPLFWLRITLEVSQGLNFFRGDFLQQIRGQRSFFEDFFSLKWYERVKRSYLIIPGQRGVFYFTNGRMNTTGVFGIFQQSEEFPGKEELVVYPRVVPLSSLGIRLNYPSGFRPREGWLFSDPLNRVGVRPYQPTDSMRKINWKASARHLQLESDINQPAFEPELHLFLSTRTTERAWEGFDRNLLELAIIYAASVIDYSCRRDFRVGLYTDGMARPGGSYGAIRPGRDPGQRSRLLTALARLNPHSFYEFKNILGREMRQIRPGSTVVVICPFLEQDLKRYLSEYHRKYRLILITDRREEGEVPEGLGTCTYYLDRGGLWNEIETLKLAK